MLHIDIRCCIYAPRLQFFFNSRGYNTGYIFHYYSCLSKFSYFVNYINVLNYNIIIQEAILIKRLYTRKFKFLVKVFIYKVTAFMFLIWIVRYKLKRGENIYI